MDVVSRPRFGRENHEVPPGTHGGPMYDARCGRGCFAAVRCPVRLSTSLALLVALLACSDTTPPVPLAYGSIHVTSTTHGVDVDADGYLIVVDNGRPEHLPPNGSIIFSDVHAGSREVRIESVSTNCTVGAGPLQRVAVTAGHSVTLNLTITCVARVPETPPAISTLELTTKTNGVELDPNGYSVLVNSLLSAPSTSLFLPVNGTVKVDLLPGPLYLVVLYGVAANCHIAGTESLTRAVALRDRETTGVIFEITCEPNYPARLASGTQLAFVRDGAIHLVNSDGTGVVKLTDGPADCDPAWSPDGRRLAFVRGCGTPTTVLYIMNADGSTLVRRAPGPFISDPAWSPDGSRIAFAGASNGSTDVYVLGADDVSRETLLVALPGWDAQPAWAPDGKSVAFASDYYYYDGVSDVLEVNVSERRIDRITTAGFDPTDQYFEPAWSRDGSKIAFDKCVLEYYTCDSGMLAVMNRDGSGIRPLAAIRGWASPTWAPDGATIAFTRGEDINWIHAAGEARGFIVGNGHSPAWRPLAPHK